MDQNTVTVIVIGIFALIVIAAILKFRRGVKAKVSGPFDTSLELDASNPQPTAGATVEDANSRRGSVRAKDLTGRGATVRRAEAQGDITATSQMPNDSDPKA